MARIYDDASDLRVSCTVIYVDDGNAYNDADCTDQITTSDLKNAFEKNLIVNVDGTLYETLAYSESEGIGTVKYTAIDDGIVTVASAVSKADPVVSKEIVKVYPDNPVLVLFGAKVSDLQRGLKVEDGKISGLLLNYTETCDLTQYWGTGNFMALKFATDAVKVKKIEVGFVGGGHSGLSELDSDMDGVWKVANTTDKFTVKTTFLDDSVNIQELDLSGITLQGAN